MPLRFITGNSGSGKSYAAYHKLIERSMKHPDINYIVLVPEQFTMQTQKELVSLHPNHGIFNIDILSFQRMAYRIFEETGRSALPMLEETGKSLVLERIAQEQKKNLTVLRDSLKKPGTISSMKSMVSELKQYCILPEELSELAEKKKNSPLLSAKLHDIQVIYEAFEEYLDQKYVTAEDILSVLAEKIPESDILSHAEILVDGFTGFTPVQIRVLQALMRQCLLVEVTVILDEREDLYAPYRAHQLFAMSRLMGLQLTHAAADIHCEILPVETVQRSAKSRFAGNPAMDFLEQNLFRTSHQIFPGEQNAIRICQYQSPKKELEDCARMIHRLIRTKGYRYRDFAILCGDFSSYKNLAEEVFKNAQMPVFLDEKRSILDNPFSEYIRAACDLAVSDFSYESVFRYLRCGFSDLTRQETDCMENYVLGLGIRGAKAYQNTWTRHTKTIEAGRVPAFNEIRKKFWEETNSFYEAFHKKDASVLERCMALYELIAGRNIQKRLDKMADEFELCGRNSLAREYRQIYGIVMNLLEKYVEVLGEEKLKNQEYQQILEAGLTECSVGVIPPNADRIVIGDNERTRLKDTRILFFCGCNDGAIPKRNTGGGILSEYDREELEKENLQLSPDARTEMYMQRFHLYRNLTKPSDALYLSYALTGTAGDAQSPSYLIRIFKELFPQSLVETKEEDSLADRIEVPELDVEELLAGLNQAMDGRITPEFLELFRYYKEHEKIAGPVDLYLDAAFTHCPEGVIARAAATALYGKEINASPTRLERYAACAFAHFLEFGLRLKERDTYEFQSSDFGTIMHQALEQFARKLSEQNLSWKDLDTETEERIVGETLEEVLADYGNTILEQTERDRYQKERVKRLMLRTVDALAKQLKLGEFEPAGLEVSFAMQDGLNAVNLSLEDLGRIHLKGRIDRVDLCETDDHVYVKIIDYKTGNTDLNLVALYYGLQVQLLIYMDAALELEEQKHPDKVIEPAGIFYYHVEDPILEKKEGETVSDLADRILSKLKPGGLVNSDREIWSRMDKTLCCGQDSAVIPLGISKDGKLNKRSSKAASTEDMEILRKYAGRKIRELGQGILEGNVRISPYRQDKKTPCEWCAYKSVCAFDRKVPGYEYRTLPSIDKDQVLIEMKKILEGE